MIDKYKSISEEILKIVNSEEVDDFQLKIKLEKRQKLISSLQGQTLDSFRDYYKNNGLYDIDKKIKTKLNEHMIDVRKELSQYKLNKKGNTVYANMNKNNLNIFSRKV